MPAEAYCRSPGFCLASAISSFTECTGRSGLTDSTIGPLPMMPIGANALIGS